MFLIRYTLQFVIINIKIKYFKIVYTDEINYIIYLGESQITDSIDDMEDKIEECKEEAENRKKEQDLGNAR